jgi:hypothetical protein
MLGEIYPAFLATFGIGQHPRNAGAMLTAVGEYVFVHGSLRRREFAQIKSLNLAGLALDLADRPSLFGLNLLEPRLAESLTTVIIPLDDRVIFVSLLNCAQFPSRRSEVAQTLDAISGIEFLAGGGGLGERWFLGTVTVRRCAGV